LFNIKTAIAKARHAVNWRVYHELELPLDAIASSIERAGAHPWHINAIVYRGNRGEVCSAMDWIVRNIPRDRTIVETACGAGGNLIWLAQQGFTDLTGTDHLAPEIAAAKNLASLAQQNVTFEVFEGFVPAQGRVDVLLSLNSIYYAPLDMALFLKACRDRLASGGYLIFDMVDASFNAVPNNEYWTDDWHLPPSMRRPTQYQLRMSIDELAEHAKATGYWLVETLPGGKLPPRYVAVLQRAESDTAYGCG
jgi:SAM-dependent methyltransferase